ncbi:MAG: chalcone isomerase family protein [Myxococcaceae bacterium]|nr:chalcone isomerase family protein [Myxococcaceae bacterium]MCI0671977.1 chalcone isomerase family protein [Myxococcaceae bacterium]
MALLLVLWGTAGLAAHRVAGVEVPSSVEVEGEQLPLNGAGLARRFVFDVHVTGLYMEEPTRSAREAIRSEQKKHLEFWFKRGLSNAQLSHAVRVGLRQNARGSLGELSERIEQLLQALPAVRAGESLAMTYVPGEGTVISHNGRTVLTVPGKDFADALFSAWLGPRPISSGLKAALLKGGD